MLSLITLLAQRLAYCLLFEEGKTNGSKVVSELCAKEKREKGSRNTVVQSLIYSQDFFYASGKDKKERVYVPVKTPTEQKSDK